MTNVTGENVVRLKPAKIVALEHKIYVNWAFTQNAQEKATINRKIYDELRSKIKISSDTKHMPEDADLILTVDHKPYHNEYKVYKNRTNLTADEIALIVDDGNLCFGYSGTDTGGTIWID